MQPKIIDCGRITDEVARLCVEANKILPPDICDRIASAGKAETSELARSIMGDIGANIEAAKRLDLPVCQDTGMAVVFVEIGSRVLVDGDVYAAVNEGVRRGYVDGLLRCSVVSDPLRRVNTGDNTPAIIHTSFFMGDSIKITVAPKGFGSENMSCVKMLTPAAGRDDVIAAVTEAVVKAGSNPCPPVVVGVGIGGDFEYAAILAKRALCRDSAVRNSDPYYAQLEEDMLRAINETGIGPQGFGGKTTALCVNIEQFATHIAGLPLAVNMGCHVTRHMSAEIF